MLLTGSVTQDALAGAADAGLGAVDPALAAGAADAGLGAVDPALAAGATAVQLLGGISGGQISGGQASNNGSIAPTVISNGIFGSRVIPGLVSPAPVAQYAPAVNQIPFPNVGYPPVPQLLNLGSAPSPLPAANAPVFMTGGGGGAVPSPISIGSIGGAVGSPSSPSLYAPQQVQAQPQVIGPAENPAAIAPQPAQPTQQVSGQVMPQAVPGQPGQAPWQEQLGHLMEGAQPYVNALGQGLGQLFGGQPAEAANIQPQLIPPPPPNYAPNAASGGGLQAQTAQPDVSNPFDQIDQATEAMSDAANKAAGVIAANLAKNQMQSINDFDKAMNDALGQMKGVNKAIKQQVYKALTTPLPSLGGKTRLQHLDMLDGKISEINDQIESLQADPLTDREVEANMPDYLVRPGGILGAINHAIAGTQINPIEARREAVQAALGARATKAAQLAATQQVLQGQADGFQKMKDAADARVHLLQTTAMKNLMDQLNLKRELIGSGNEMLKGYMQMTLDNNKAILQRQENQIRDQIAFGQLAIAQKANDISILKLENEQSKQDAQIARDIQKAKKELADTVTQGIERIGKSSKRPLKIEDIRGIMDDVLKSVGLENAK